MTLTATASLETYAAAPPWAELAGQLSPAAGLSTEVADRAAVRSDWSGNVADGLPEAVVHAATVADVQEALRFASRYHVPVVPRGAGTGLSGGATAGRGSLVLDLRRMDAIRELRVEDGVAVVEPGVLTADLDRAARQHGLRYAPDPASVEISTIGGNVATNAGGLRCVKYGVTRDAVLSLDVVLADGRLVSTGRTTAKGVTGYDLTSLLVGSEGTLAVIVGVTVRLTPVPLTTATAAAWFASTTEAVAASLAITGAGVRPSTCELLDHATLVALDAASGDDLSTRADAFLLVQTDGFGAEAEMAVVASVLGRTAQEVQMTTNPAAGERLVATRRAALPAIERQGRVVIEDIAVPRSRLADAVTGIAAIAAATGVPIFTFAHAGDGNLHPILLVTSEQPADLARVDQAADAVFALALELGGTLTGEHGVGLLKRPWLDAELGPVARELQQQVKAVFDPQQLLNPGKAI